MGPDMHIYYNNRIRKIHEDFKRGNYSEDGARQLINNISPKLNGINRQRVRLFHDIVLPNARILLLNYLNGQRCALRTLASTENDDFASFVLHEMMDVLPSIPVYNPFDGSLMGFDDDDEDE